MASISLLEVSIAIFCFIFLYCFLFKKPHERFLINWPLLGMFPGLFFVLHCIFDFGVELLEKANLTFLIKGPWFAGMDMLVTVDPANIHYMLSSNFSNYTKGAELKKVLDAFEDSFIADESEDSKKLNKVNRAMISHQGFQKLSMSTTRSKLKDGLVPLFNHFAERGTVVDLQDVFSRFTFDTTVVTVTGYDPKYLSTEMPKDELAKALDDVVEGVLYRHIKPKFVWELQYWMGVGREKKMREANATFDRVCAKFVSAKREEIKSSLGVDHDHIEEEGEALLTSYLKLDAAKHQVSRPINDKFLRDNVLAFIVAGKYTVASALTWFFWLLSENPKVLSKIRQEISSNLPSNSTGQESQSCDQMEFLNKLVYLHGALCETLRLYPPIPVERVSPVESDVLPSGHKVEANSKILIFIYSLGRMRAVWGENALEFKPERWISETGTVRREPSYKFLAFNAGPRSCLGKHLAMVQMKTLVVEILQNYDITVAKEHKTESEPGLVLTMKHGFRVTINKRCSY